MEIHFCDLCNESVPETDLALGRAVRRGDRVVCGACESAMSAASIAPPAPGPPMGPRGVAEAPRPPAPARPASAGSAAPEGPARAPRRSGGLFLAVLALVLGAAAAAYFATELERERSQRRDEAQGWSAALAAVSDRQDLLARELAAERETLGSQWRGLLADQRAAAESGFTHLQDRLAALDEGLESLSSTLEGLRADQARGADDSGRRLDELVGRLAAQREEGRLLGLRVDDLAQALVEAQERGPLQPLPVSDGGPAWMARVADLSSSDASLRYYAVLDLAGSGDPAVVGYLVGLLRDPDLFVQMATARVLGELGAPAAIEPLIDALEDPQEAVRETAVLALRGLTGRNFRFEPAGSPAERARRVTAWREWWAKARSDYL